jgi:cell wall-associated NlpC family hydrolase
VTDPQPGDFGLCSISGDVGRLIRLGQWLNGDGFTGWEHAFVFVGDGQIVEAMPGGARLADVSEYDGRPLLWSTGRIPLTDGQRAAVAGAARGFLGVPYGFGDYLSLALLRFHVRPGWVKRRVASNRTMICSQLVDASLLAAGVHLYADGRIPGDVTPGDLWELIRS